MSDDPADGKVTEMSGDNDHKLLIVDDDPLVLESVSSLLKMWGYEVLTCGSAHEAIEKCRKGVSIWYLRDLRGRCLFVD